MVEEIGLAPPLADDPAALELVRWYFEDHLRYPILDSDLAEKALEVPARDLPDPGDTDD